MCIPCLQSKSTYLLVVTITNFYNWEGIPCVIDKQHSYQSFNTFKNYRKRITILAFFVEVLWVVATMLGHSCCLRHPRNPWREQSMSKEQDKRWLWQDRHCNSQFLFLNVKHGSICTAEDVSYCLLLQLLSTNYFFHANSGNNN